jgi:hypothetical protein
MLGGCSGERDFDADVSFLSAHKETIVLSAPGGSGRVAVVPAYQGRVMTSTVGGAAPGKPGQSYGFIKYDLIESGKLAPGINAFGGEDRFWMGPEGGQFSIFFAPGVTDQAMKHWQTPPCIDTDEFKVASRSAHAIVFTHRASLVNNSGTAFALRIDRTVRVLDPRDAGAALGVDLTKTSVVAYESENTITNEGTNTWTRESGMLSIWILGMMKHSPATTVVVPVNVPHGQSLDGLVNDSYFGKVPTDRLRTVAREGAGGRGTALLFKADGQMRTKIGVSPRGVMPTAGSFDASRNVLTLMTFTIPPGATEYVNSMWESHQKEPFAGDVLNSYNDGPSSPGAAPFGPFYELESSSPAAGLSPGNSMTHVHRTMHIEGARDQLDRIARKTLGVDLGSIEGAFR